LRERRFGLIERGDEKAGIKVREHFAAMDLTVIVDIEFRNGAGDLRPY
jgi:hypothetical protein